MKVYVWLLLGVSLLCAEAVEKAEKYHKLLLRNSTNAVLMERFVNAWLDEGERDDLEKWLEEGVAEGGVAQRRVLARYYETIGSRERALAEYEEVLMVEPEDGETALAVAKLRGAGLDFEGALQVLAGREDVEAVTLRGTYEQRLGNTKAALELWRGLLKKKPQDRELREDLVSLFREEGLGEEARALQAELVMMEKDPLRRALDELDLGDLQLEDELRDEALQSYRKVLAQSGSASWLEREALHKISEVFRRERDVLAFGDFLKSLREEMPHRLTLQKSFARQQVLLGEVAEGVAAFREILRRAPGDVALREEFIELLAFAGRFEEAAEEMSSLIEVGVTAERWLRLAELQNEGDEERGKAAALGSLAELEEMKKGDPAGVLEMARIYSRFSAEDEALRVLREGYETWGNSREIAEALAGRLVEGEKKDEALKVWRAMLQEGGMDEVVRVAKSQVRKGLAGEAFDLLKEHRDAVEKDFDSLRLYCELALELKDDEAGWAGARRLVEQVQAFSELKVAVPLGLALARKRGIVEAIAEMGEEETEGGLCLLASLWQEAGKFKKADAVLEGGEGELLRRHGISLLTRRGDYDEAVALLREMMRERASLVERRQLLSLLEQKGDFEGALTEVEVWKIVSPKEVLAWKKRAALLTKLGRPGEAADELRRARNVFGKDDVALTRELAKLQLPLGRHREALRLYKHLFRAAQTDGERFKFLDEMYAAAQQAGLQGELLRGFEQEHERAKTEEFPLRVLSRLHQLSHHAGARQEVLLKLYRLRPDDEKVLFELVALAEQNNDREGAKRLLMEHAARVKSSGILQQMATLQIKAGEVDAALEILSRIRPNEMGAEGVERVVSSLWHLREYELGLEFLTDHEVTLNVDWRLRFLRAEFLAAMARTGEARAVWESLLGVKGALGRTAPSPTYQGRYLPKAGEMNERAWWGLVQSVVNEGYDNWRGSQRGVGHLPTNEHELHWLSLLRLVEMSLQEDPSGESWAKLLGKQDHEWLLEVRQWGLFPKKNAGVLTATQEGELSFELRLQNLIKDAASTREDFLKLAGEVEGLVEKARLVMRCRIYACLKLPEGEKQFNELRQLVAEMLQGEREGKVVQPRGRQFWVPDVSWELVQAIAPGVNYSISPSMPAVALSLEQRKKLGLLEPWWRHRVERAFAGEIHEVGKILAALAVQRLAGDLEGFFENLDRLLTVKLPPQQNPYLRRAASYGGRHGVSLQGVSDRNTILNSLGSRHWLYAAVGPGHGPKLLSAELLKKAHDLDWEIGGQEELREFAKGIPQVKDRLLRAILFHKVGLEEKFMAEMEVLGKEGGLSEKLDVLALRFDSSSGVMNVPLLRALLAMDRGELNGTDTSVLDGVILGEARKGRDLKDLDEELRATLGEVLGRYTKSAGGRSRAMELQSLYRPLGLAEPQHKRNVGRTQRGQQQSYRRLLNVGRDTNAKRLGESEEERRERESLTYLGRHFSSNNDFVALRKLVDQEGYRQIREEALAFYDPGESRSYLKRFQYAQLCLAYEEREKAGAILTKLSEERPYDAELEVLSFSVYDREEQEEKLGEILGRGEVGRAMKVLLSLVQLTDEEERFFELYESLIQVLEDHGENFQKKETAEMFTVFQGVENRSRQFRNGFLRSLRSRLPRVKEGEGRGDSDWARRRRQRELVRKAYGELLRFRSVRENVWKHLLQNQDGLTLYDKELEEMFFDLLEKEPVKESDFKVSEEYRSGDVRHFALEAIQDLEKFSDEVVDDLVRHAFLSEEQGEVVKAVRQGDVVKVEKLLEGYEGEAKLKGKGGLRRSVTAYSNFRWGSSSSYWPPSSHGLLARQKIFLESLLRSKKLQKTVRGVLEKSFRAMSSDYEFQRAMITHTCEHGSLEESFRTIETVAAQYFPPVSARETYEEFKDLGAIPTEVMQKVQVGQMLLSNLENIPRAWIPWLTFLEKSEQAEWVSLDQERVRSQLQRRLDVMYQSTFYDRLKREGFQTYDGLALLGEERVSKSGGPSSYLEELITPLRLSPTEGKTYWLLVSADFQKRLNELSYLEAFIAMRKDFKISPEERQQVLKQVLEFELEELSQLEESQLRGLAILMERDFPDLEIPDGSEELQSLLGRLRAFSFGGVVQRAQKIMASEKRMGALSDNEARGLCARLAKEAKVEEVVDFWVAYLETREGGRGKVQYDRLNEELLEWKPFQESLDLMGSIRFVRLMREALPELSQMDRSNPFVWDFFDFSGRLSPYLSEDGDLADLIPFLDETLQREGVGEADKRMMGSFLIINGFQKGFKKMGHRDFLTLLSRSGLSAHSPMIVETLGALAQVEGKRDGKLDKKAFKVLYAYLLDERLSVEVRQMLASAVISQWGHESVAEFRNAEAVALVLRDFLLTQGGHRKGLSSAGEMTDFVNQNLLGVSEELQKELYEAWAPVVARLDGRQLEEKISGGRDRRLVEVILEFFDGGRRYPLPEALIGELSRRFSGNLQIMYQFALVGNVELVAKLLPTPERGFQLEERKYTAFTKRVGDELSSALPADYQILLKCFLASLRDDQDWVSSQKSRGDLKADRAIAAAELFLKNPPEQQAVRVLAINFLLGVPEAKKMIVPSFTKGLAEDLVAIAKQRRGDLRYMLQWVRAGGVETIGAFAPDQENTLRLSGIYTYQEGVAELEEALAPLLSPSQRMRLICYFALLRDFKGNKREGAPLPPRDERLQKAARYILENPLAEQEEDVQKECVVKLVYAGLPEAEGLALMQRGSGDLEKMDADFLSGLSTADMNFLALQLKKSLEAQNGDKAMRFLRIVVKDDTKISEIQRERLLEVILPKVLLRLLALAVQDEDGKIGEELLSELKELSGLVFRKTFSAKMKGEESFQRAALFFAFVTHCLSGDEAGYASLENGVSAEGARRLVALQVKKRSSMRSYYEDVTSVIPGAQALYFDGSVYLSEGLKPLRKRLFTQLRERGLTEEMSAVFLMNALGLRIADVDLSEDEIAAERGEIDLIASALAREDTELFLALLATEEEAYFRRKQVTRKSNTNGGPARRDLQLHRLEELFKRDGGKEVLALIEDDFQRMHLEVFLQTIMSSYYIRGRRFNLREFDDEMEAEILELLPEAGPAQTQILACLGSRIHYGSELEEMLVAHAREGHGGFRKSSNHFQTIGEGERLDIFLHGWIRALRDDDWSVLDYQFKQELEDSIFQALTHAAFVQALHEVAGDGAKLAKVREKLAGYGVKRNDVRNSAWFEVIEVVAGAKKSAWVERVKNLEPEKKEEARVKMRAQLEEILNHLTWVRIPEGQYASESNGRIGGMRKVWLSSQVQEQSQRVLNAVLNDESGVFSAAKISPEERIRLMFENFSWEPLSDLTKDYFEGERELKLLTEIALEKRPSRSSKASYKAFLEELAPRVEEGSKEGNRLWLKVATSRKSAGNLKGAREACEKVDISLLENYKRSSFEELKESLEEIE